MKIGPDGVVGITRSGDGISGSWVVAANEGDKFVLGEWAEFHRSLLGFIPSWFTVRRFSLVGKAPRLLITWRCLSFGSE